MLLYLFFDLFFCFTSDAAFDPKAIEMDQILYFEMNVGYFIIDDIFIQSAVILIIMIIDLPEMKDNRILKASVT